jgi:pimeloyl-ACP methyl ester carboxylesterase
MRVVFVHGACVRDGSWWWHPTAELLAERDVASEAPALPSCGETGEAPDAQGPGLAEDVAAVREVLTKGDEPAPFLDIDPEGGTFTVRPDALVETFLRDCDPEIQRQASDKMARQSLAILEQPVRAAAWQQVASTYLVCAEDRGTPVDLQREFAARAGSVVELDAGHHPFLSQPAAVRDLVLSL